MVSGGLGDLDDQFGGADAVTVRVDTDLAAAFRFDQQEMIRLRFTPAKGLIYGASAQRKDIDKNGNEVSTDDAVVAGRVIYDGASVQQKWLGWIDSGDANTTNPGAIFGGFDDKAGNHVSWGYLDDECDGLVTVELTTQPGRTLSAFARIGAQGIQYYADPAARSPARSIICTAVVVSISSTPTVT